MTPNLSPGEPGRDGVAFRIVHSPELNARAFTPGSKIMRCDLKKSPGINPEDFFIEV